jgi:two-component system alkaline phosphatase synthesis response regulator PhoP
MGKTILITEDQENILELLTAIFSDTGYKIISAKDGEKALNMVYLYKPDIILLDIQLPKVNGFDVCNSIKSNPALSRTKVLMLSSQAQECDFQKAWEGWSAGIIRDKE